MLSGYNRAASIVDSHFAWTGGTAIAAWGRTDELSDGGIHGYDATPGDIPQGTVIDSNIMRESGIWVRAARMESLTRSFCSLGRRLRSFS